MAASAYGNTEPAPAQFAHLQLPAAGGVTTMQFVACAPCRQARRLPPCYEAHATPVAGPQDRCCSGVVCYPAVRACAEATKMNIITSVLAFFQKKHVRISGVPRLQSRHSDTHHHATRALRRSGPGALVAASPSCVCWRTDAQGNAAKSSQLMLHFTARYARPLPPRWGIAGFETQPSTNFPEQVHRHSIERWCDEAGELPAAQTDKRKPPLTGRGAPILSHEGGNDDGASSTVSLPSLSPHQTPISYNNATPEWMVPSRATRRHLRLCRSALFTLASVSDTIAIVIVIGIISGPNSSNTIVYTRGTAFLHLHSRPSHTLFVALASQPRCDEGIMAEERVIRISRPIRSPLKPYTTGETIHGTVHFTSPRTIPFRQVRVWLVGAARTTTIAAMPAGTQTWLILLMREPMACGQWFPMPGESFRAFVKYTMDFSYTIPERIHDACCYGNCTSADDVAERHGRLPPSMGYWHLNDMSPRVAEIIWCISAEEIRESPGSHPTWTMTVQAPIKILPFSPEEPPRLIEPDDSRYKLSRTKKLKENLLPFSRSIGTLKATTSQPPAIMIDPDTFDSLPSCALIDLLFSPAKRPGAPPKIQSVKIEIQACTFYSSRPMHCVPDLGTVQPALGTACIPSEYTTTRTIVTVFPDAPEWKCNQCGQFWRERSPPVSLPPRRPPVLTEPAPLSCNLPGKPWSLSGQIRCHRPKGNSNGQPRD
ncbi:hypothetical protein ACCO45_007980 [Purpureocillium lilacinum]|uniref:Uncharacterized protein n=1 Tax=Purpureocillium lilacinum TaxID=33203 RepID=A0ACC4DMU4_PURLI